jgi:hypothetical protein
MASIEWRGGETCRITVSRPKTVGYGYEKIRKTITLPANLTEKQKKKEVEKAALLFEESIKSGDYLDGEKITLGEFIQIWMREYAEKELAPSTLVHYKMRIEKRILPALGHLKIARIQPGHITAFYNNLTEENIRLDGIFTPTAAMLDKLTPHSNSDLSKETGLGRNIFLRLKTLLNAGKRTVYNYIAAVCKAGTVPSQVYDQAGQLFGFAEYLCAQQFAGYGAVTAQNIPAKAGYKAILLCVDGLVPQLVHIQHCKSALLQEKGNMVFSRAIRPGQANELFRFFYCFHILSITFLRIGAQ